MKKFFVFTVAAAMLLSLAACTQNAEPAAQPDMAAQEEVIASDTVQIPSPWTEYATAEEATEAAGFTLTAPDEIAGTSEKIYQVMKSEDTDVVLSEILYRINGERAAYVRKAPGSDDISGDYSDYAEEQTVEAGDVSVTLKGNDGLVYLALWTDGGYSYALNVTAGLSQSDMAALVSEIR